MSGAPPQTISTCSPNTSSPFFLPITLLCPFLHLMLPTLTAGIALCFYHKVLEAKPPTNGRLVSEITMEILAGLCCHRLPGSTFLLRTLLPSEAQRLASGSLVVRFRACNQNKPACMFPESGPRGRQHSKHQRFWETRTFLSIKYSREGFCFACGEHSFLLRHLILRVRQE